MRLRSDLLEEDCLSPLRGSDPQFLHRARMQHQHGNSSNGLLCFFFIALNVVVLICSPCALAQAGSALDREAWLRYARLDAQAAKSYERLPSTSVLLGKSLILEKAQRELANGFEKMLGRNLKSSGDINDGAFVLGTIHDLQKIAPSIQPRRPLESDGYWLADVKIRDSQSLVITASNDRGVLFGGFPMLRKIAR